MNKVFKRLREWNDLIIALAIVVVLRTFVFQIYKIPTTSMAPTLKPGDKIFVSKIVYGPKVPFTPWRIPGLRRPKHGEIIVFIAPHDRKKFYIKRLIGMGGDRILIDRGNIRRNGKLVVDAPVANNNYYNQGDYGMQRKEIIVPEGQYFFLGDNSISSYDSRFWGYVEEKDVVGKAIFIWWPPKRMGMIE